MMFDTDIFIWLQRGNKKAAQLMQNVEERTISVQTYMELFQCASSKAQHQVARSFLAQFNVEVLPFTENIGHRAAIYIEEYSLSNGIRAGDAIIAATAVEGNQILSTSNRKHFKDIKDLQLKIFRP